MADKKISALTSATTPLAGTEVLPIVQSGSTVKVAVSDLTVGRAVSAASLALTTTPLPATSGGTGANSAFTTNGVLYASSTTALATSSALLFDGTNLGLSVTPSSWSLFTAAEIGARGNFISSYNSGGVYVGSNSYFNGTNWIYKISNAGSAPTIYYGANGTHNWQAGAQGTAGNTITFSTTMSLDASGNLTISGATATKASGITWANPSDQRLKNNIRDYTKGTIELMQVRVREWEYNGKGGTTEGLKGLGVVADEVMEILPNTVENYDAKLNSDDKETTEIKKFDATEITWLLVKTAQEQQSVIEAQSKTIINLIDRIATLESK